tara:strand:- start:77 stop:283 length:207 start_codon:yes stop_codon:yes gene_type:complete
MLRQAEPARFEQRDSLLSLRLRHRLRCRLHRRRIGLRADVGKVGDRHSLIWEGEVDCQLNTAHALGRP